VPSVWRRHPADRLQTAFRVRNHPWPSHSWQPPVAADFLSANPGPIRKILIHLGESLEPPPVSPACGPPTDWGELVQIHFRPRHLSDVARRAARNRHPQPLTAAASQVTTKPPGRRTRRGSAPTREKRHSRGGRQADRERPGAHPGDWSTRLTSRASVGRCSRKCHWPGSHLRAIIWPGGWDTLPRWVGCRTLSS
jgi:hypothetical protein